MKTTVELPDVLFRQAKATAAANGISLREFLTTALAEKLQRPNRNQGPRPWMRHWGVLAQHREALQDLDRIIEEECEQIDPKDWE